MPEFATGVPPVSALLPDSPGFVQSQTATQSAAPPASGPAAQTAAQANAPSAAGVGTASISGLVLDLRGGLVPGATISLLDRDGRVDSTATSGSEGRFRFDNLREGTWKLRIAAAGLQTFEPPPIVLKVGEHFELPDTAMPIATASQSVDVVMTQQQIAEQELNDETRQRVLGIFPNFYTSYEWNAAPLVTQQKFKLAYRATTDPLIFVTTAIVAGIQQERNTYPGYGDDAAAYGKRFGAQYGDAVVGRFIGSAILPSIFRQDPRYFYMGPPSSTKKRLAHAILFSVVARGDNGKSQPNYSHILGNFIAGYISRTWHPDTDNGFRLAIDNALIGIAGAGLQGLEREFLWRHISSHTPPYANGKPPDTPPVPVPPASKPPAAEAAAPHGAAIS